MIIAKLGIAPINWTNDDVPSLGGEIPFEQCISEMALAGYEGCEVGNKFPTHDPEVLKKALEIRGIRICNQWFSYQFTTLPFEEHKQQFIRHLDFLETMGVTTVGGGEFGNSVHGKKVPVLEEKVILTAEEWKNVTEGLDEFGKIAADRGIRLAFHPHIGTGVQDLEETKRVMENTNPDYVGINYDCGHFYFAGEDPIEVLRLFGSRVAHVHLKDVRYKVLQQVKSERLSFLDAVVAGVFTTPGDPEGCTDFPALFSILNEHDYDQWLVVEAEQDPAKANPFEYAKNARVFVEKQIAALG